MNIFLVFYTRPEAEDDAFLSAHLDYDDARKAAAADAKEQGHRIARTPPKRPNLGRGWRWGLATVEGNPNIVGGKEDPNIFTDWTDDDSGQYEVTAVPLHGAAHLVHEIQHQCLRLLGEA